MKQWRKRILSLMLTLALVAGLAAGFPLGAQAEEPPESVPQAEADAPQVKAADEKEATPTDEKYGTAELEVFDVAAASTDVDINDPYKILGLSTPEPERADDAPTPLGDEYTVTFSELLVAGNRNDGSEFVNGKLFGSGAKQNNALNQQGQTGNYDDFLLYRSDYPDDSKRRQFSFAYKTEGAIAMEGDFSASGRKHQIAMLSYWQNHKMELWVGDAAAITEGILDMYQVAEFSADGANTNNSMTTPSDDLHLKTGDVNGDGFDEIVLLIPDYSNSSGKTSRLVVLGRKNTGGVAGESTENDISWNLADGWGIIYDKKFDIGFKTKTRQGGGTSNKYVFENTSSYHALAVGDLNGDGRDDIALAGSKITISGYESYSRFTNQKDYISDTSQASVSVLISPSTGDYTTSTVTSKTYDHNIANSSNSPLFGSTSAGALLPALDKSILGDAKDKPNLCLLPSSLGLDIVNVDDANGNELLVGVNLYASHGKELDNTQHYKSIAPSLGYQVHQLSYNNETAELSQASNVKPLQVFEDTIYRVSNKECGSEKISGSFVSIYTPGGKNAYGDIIKLDSILPVGSVPGSV